MRNGVDVTVEEIGDAGDMPADGGGAFTVAWVRAGLVAGPHRLPSNKPHRRTQKNQSESPCRDARCQATAKLGAADGGHHLSLRLDQVHPAWDVSPRASTAAVAGAFTTRP